MSLIPTHGRQTEGSLEVKASLIYRVSSRTARDIQRNPVSGREEKAKKEKHSKICLGSSVIQ